MPFSIMYCFIFEQHAPSLLWVVRPKTPPRAGDTKTRSVPPSSF